jgi:hypothetical protein
MRLFRNSQGHSFPAGFRVDFKGRIGGGLRQLLNGREQFGIQAHLIEQRGGTITCGECTLIGNRALTAIMSSCRLETEVL